jgi:CelD/BcsL family acetyltransferase involved in cellulose biosynthesis
MVQVRVLHSDLELENLRLEWNETLSESSADCLFLTWEWLTSWWRHLKNDRTLHVIEVRDDTRPNGRLIGLAPLMNAGGRLEFMGTGTAGSDYLDLIARRGSEDAIVEAVASQLEATGLNLRLSHVLPGSLVLRLAERLNTRGYRIFKRPLNVCPFMPLPSSWDAFLATLGKRHRENVRRRIRKLPEGAQFELTQTEEQLLENFPRLIELHNERWDTRGGSDALQTAGMKAFHEDFTRLALQCGWLRLFVLKIEGRAAAAVYAFSRKGKALYYQAGISPKYSDLSLGLVALALAIKHAIEEGATEYDFLHGDEGYKSLWASDKRELLLLEAYPASLKGRLSMHSHRVIRAAKTMARYVIAR